MHIWESWGVLGCPRVSCGIKTDRAKKGIYLGFLLMFIKTDKISTSISFSKKLAVI